MKPFDKSQANLFNIKEKLNSCFTAVKNSSYSLLEDKQEIISEFGKLNSENEALKKENERLKEYISNVLHNDDSN